MTNPQLIENLLAGDKRALAPHPCRGKPSWLPWGGAGPLVLSQMEHPPVEDRSTRRVVWGRSC